MNLATLSNLGNCMDSLKIPVLMLSTNEMLLQVAPLIRGHQMGMILMSARFSISYQIIANAGYDGMRANYANDDTLAEHLENSKSALFNHFHKLHPPPWPPFVMQVFMLILFIY
jgi:hypothetical protein